MKLALSKLQCKFQEITFSVFWFPQKTLSAAELEEFKAVLDESNRNFGHSSYGYFSPQASEDFKKQFLENSIWCIAFLNQKPVATVYNYYLGVVNDRHAIHSGLVKLLPKLGKQFIHVPYCPLTLGNILNFGSHYYTNISQLPTIVESFSNAYIDVWPHYEKQSEHLRQNYKSVLDLLAAKYVVPILGLKAEMLDLRHGVVRGSLEALGGEFETSWDLLPKADSTLCNIFMREYLGTYTDQAGKLRLRDDLIQIGMCDFRAFFRDNAEACKVYNSLTWLEMKSWQGDASAIGLPLLPKKIA